MSIRPVVVWRGWTKRQETVENKILSPRCKLNDRSEEEKGASPSNNSGWWFVKASSSLHSRRRTASRWFSVKFSPPPPPPPNSCLASASWSVASVASDNLCSKLCWGGVWLPLVGSNLIFNKWDAVDNRFKRAARSFSAANWSLVGLVPRFVVRVIPPEGELLRDSSLK